MGDPRDGEQEARLRDLAEDPHGIYDCTHCFACVEVCPKDVAPMNQIMRLRRRATDDYGIKDANNGYGHEKAFVNLIEKYGTLHEAQLLPRSFGDGSLVKGQLRPSGAKQLTEAAAHRHPRAASRARSRRGRRCSTRSCPTRSRCGASSTRSSRRTSASS